METKEKVFKITTWHSSTYSIDSLIPESELEEKHINLFAGELIKQYQELPEKSKKLIKDYLNIPI